MAPSGGSCDHALGRRSGHPLNLSRRVWCAAALGWLFFLAPIPVQGQAGESEKPVSLSAARLPQAELGSEFWSLAASFESGHRLFLELCISNVGFGDGNAALLGHWITPDGEIISFDQARSAKGWELSEDRLGFVIGKVSFDQRGETHQLRVTKEKLDLELNFPASAPTRLPSLSSEEHGLDLLGASAPVTGFVKTPKQDRMALRGQVARTHRWTEGLESGFVRRRIELFTLDGETSAYLVENLSPSGETSSQLVIQRAGQPTLSKAVEVTIERALQGGSPEFPVPETLLIEGNGIEGRVDLRPPLVRFDPLRDLPAVVRFAVSPFLQWRASWSASAFELKISEASTGILRLAGEGLTNVTYFNALETTPAVASPPVATACGDDCP